MRRIDSDGTALCAIQAEIFEMSIENYSTSSPIFIRRFMNSELAAEMDKEGFMEKPFFKMNSFELLDEEYGKSSYGVEKYHPDVIHWIGYIYRYWAYVYEISSRRVYGIIKPKELAGCYPGFHTMDPLAAIQRILEIKGLAPDGGYSVEKGVEILKRIREESKLKEYKAKSGKDRKGKK